MKKTNLGNTLHPKLKRIAKLTAVLISVSVIISMLSVFSLGTVQATTIPPTLHTSGHLILDENNNVVYLRGIGRTGDLQSASGMWSGPGDQVATWGQKWQPISANVADMEATLQSYRDYWKVNMIRVLVPVNWWWIDNVVANQYQSDAPPITVSYRTYIETLVQISAKYGIYVDFVPYSVLDVYTGGQAWDGIPGSLGAASLNFMQSINANEMQAWRTWWTSVVNRLGQYSNVIFEMWNEPENDKQGYFNYMIEMYKTIRGMGNQNLIFMQWYMGLVPTYHELQWIPEFHRQLRTAIAQEPLNVVYTTHPYRYAPWPNTQWQTTYSAVQAQLNSPNIVPITRSSDIDVPLVFNEMGICQTAMDNAEMNFWDSILRNSKEMGIGVVAYYWMSDSDLGPVYHGESLLTGSWAQGEPSPKPNAVGQTFLKYAPDETTPPVIATPTPIATPTSTITPSPTPSPEPIVIPTPLPEPVTQPPQTTLPPEPSVSPTQPSVPSETTQLPNTHEQSPVTETPAPTLGQPTTPEPKPSPESTKQPEQAQPLKAPAALTFRYVKPLPIFGYFQFGHWHLFFLPRASPWFYISR